MSDDKTAPDESLMPRKDLPMRTYHGSCHCGNLKYTIELPEDLTKAMHGKCNCTVCTKTNFHYIKPPDHKTFKLTEPSDPTTLGDYTYGSNIMHHIFCKVCGTKLYGRGDVPALGGVHLSLNLNCLDDVDLSVMKCTRYLDGRSGKWTISENAIAPGSW